MTDYLRQVKTSGHRLTRARQVVLQYLQTQTEPQTAADILRGVGRARVDVASVYRTMELFEELGLVCREQQGDFGAFTLSDRHHHHITCRSCHRQTCLPCAQELPTPKGFSAVQHQIRLTGVCGACAK